MQSIDNNFCPLIQRACDPSCKFLIEIDGEDTEMCAIVITACHLNRIENKLKNNN